MQAPLRPWRLASWGDLLHIAAGLISLAAVVVERFPDRAGICATPELKSGASGRNCHDVLGE